MCVHIHVCSIEASSWNRIVGSYHHLPLIYAVVRRGAPACVCLLSRSQLLRRIVVVLLIVGSYSIVFQFKHIHDSVMLRYC